MTLSNFWWILIWPFLFGLLSLIINMQHDEVVDGERCVRWHIFAACALVVPLVIWAGWRKGFVDTETYRAIFKGMPTDANQIGPYMETVTKGYGFYFLELCFKCFISNSDVAFFTVIAVIQIICLVYVYRKYSIDYWFSLFLFIASTDYLAWMHNGIRQFLAVSILFLCVPMIAKKKYVLPVILVLLASLIHSASLIFLPVIFIVNGISWNLRTMAFLLGIVVAVLFVDRITGFLTEAMRDTAYEGDIEFLQNDDGTNILRVLFYSVPTIMAWFFRPYIEQEENPLINVCVNLSIVSTGFYIFSFFSSGILMGSIPIYFSLSNYILIPWLMEKVFDHDSAVLLKVIFIAVYSLFFIYQCGPVWGLL